MIMFFSEFDKHHPGKNKNKNHQNPEEAAKDEEQVAKERPYENLAIFGAKRCRRGAELKILSAVESK